MWHAARFYIVELKRNAVSMKKSNWEFIGKKKKLSTSGGGDVQW